MSSPHHSSTNAYQICISMRLQQTDVSAHVEYGRGVEIEIFLDFFRPFREYSLWGLESGQSSNLESIICYNLVLQLQFQGSSRRTHPPADLSFMAPFLSS